MLQPKGLRVVDPTALGMVYPKALQVVDPLVSVSNYNSVNRPRSHSRSNSWASSVEWFITDDWLKFQEVATATIAEVSPHVIGRSWKTSTTTTQSRKPGIQNMDRHTWISDAPTQHKTAIMFLVQLCKALFWAIKRPIVCTNQYSFDRQHL